ncbi:YkoP family protein [Oceanobacillus damuensis]|uniref:YkoP family protein n=1 Tax=Oceanobacillus damuensis TaxID=937928 RepID=UPI000A74E904|nr:hypothetical protein [Oceanobacillus damuensis]
MNLNIKRNCVLLWNFIDPIYYHFTRLNYIQNDDGKKTIIRVRLTRYKGRKITLSDGTVINKNDILLKIHLHNVKLMREMDGKNSDIRRALIIYKSVRESLPYVARYIQSHGYTSEIKGLIGITTLHKGCRKLNFEVFSIYNPYYKMFKRIALLPIHLLSTENKWKEIPSPMYLFMSKKRLFKEYN